MGRLTLAEVFSIRNVIVIGLLSAAFGVILFAPWPVFFAMVTVGAAGAAVETCALIDARHARVLVVIGSATFLALLPASPLSLGDAIGIALLFYGGYQVFSSGSPPRHAIQNLMHAAFIWFYVFWSLGHGILLRLGPNGAEIVFVVVLFTALRNIGAGWLGRLVPGHPISDANTKKTYEGALLGWAAASAVSVPIAIVVGFSPYQAMGLSLVLGCAGQIGDLAASKLKRSAGVSDSSHVFIGQGGILDTLDSFIFCLPLSLYYCRYVGCH